MDAVRKTKLTMARAIKSQAKFLKGINKDFTNKFTLN